MPNWHPTCQQSSGSSGIWIGNGERTIRTTIIPMASEEGPKRTKTLARIHATTAHSAATGGPPAAGHSSSQEPAGQTRSSGLGQGNSFLLERVSYRGWQRRFGRSIQQRAPGMFVNRLSHLAESAGGTMITVPTWQTKLSQTCQCGQVKKKPLSLRVHPVNSVGSRCSGICIQPTLFGSSIMRPSCSTRARHTQPGQVGNPSCGRRGSGPSPVFNRRVGVAADAVPPTFGGMVPPDVRAGRPRQVCQPTPRAWRCSESRKALVRARKRYR